MEIRYFGTDMAALLARWCPFVALSELFAAFDAPTAGWSDV